MDRWSCWLNNSWMDVDRTTLSSHSSKMCFSVWFSPHKQIVMLSFLHLPFSHGKFVLPTLKRVQAILQHSGKYFLVMYTSWVARSGHHCLYSAVFVFVDYMVDLWIAKWKNAPASAVCEHLRCARNLERQPRADGLYSFACHWLRSGVEKNWHHF